MRAIYLYIKLFVSFCKAEGHFIIRHIKYGVVKRQLASAGVVTNRSAHPTFGAQIAEIVLVSNLFAGNKQPVVFFSLRFERLQTSQNKKRTQNDAPSNSNEF